MSKTEHLSRIASRPVPLPLQSIQISGRHHAALKQICAETKRPLKSQVELWIEAEALDHSIKL
jgi:hypothetical protein